MGAHLADRGTAGARIKVRTATAVDTAIDRTRLHIGRFLSGVQLRCRRVRQDHLPAEDPADVAYHRRMMMVDEPTLPPGVAEHLADVRRESETIVA